MAMRQRVPSETFLRDAAAAKAVRDKLHFLIGYSSLASGPWTILLGETAIDFRLGHRCGRAVGDPSHREAIIGCGIGLSELRLALRQLGCIDSTILLPEPGDPALLARLYIDGFEDEAAPESFLLSRALAAPLAGRGARGIDASFQEELAAHAGVERALLAFSYELPWSPSEVICGAPTLTSVAHRVPWLLSNLDPVAPMPGVDRVDPSFEWSVGAVIATRGDGPADWLGAGQALARVALRARVEGLSTRVEGAPSQAAALDGVRVQIALRMGTPRGRNAAPQDSPLSWQARPDRASA